MEQNTKLIDEQACSLYQVCQELTDCRLPRGVRHRYGSILAIALGGIISGASNYLEMGEWAQALTPAQLKKLGVKRRAHKYFAPSESTLRRTLQHTNPEQLDKALGAWARESLPTKFHAIACDGKWLRGSRFEGKTVKLMAALTHDSGVVIGQSAVPNSTNEIGAMRPLLSGLDLQDVVVTADALHTQRDFVRFLVEEKQAHYVLVVKGNQSELEQAIYQIGDEDWSDSDRSTGKGHGRVETRVTQTSAYLNEYLNDIDLFPHVEQVFKVARKVTNQKTGVITQEEVVGITSLRPQQAGAKEIGTLVRGHWAIENKLHWSRDVVFGEDRSQIHAHFGAHVMASLRNTAISLLRLHGKIEIAAARRHLARNPHLAIALICQS